MDRVKKVFIILLFVIVIFSQGCTTGQVIGNKEANLNAGGVQGKTETLDEKNQTHDYKKDELIIKFKSGVSEEDKKSLVKRFGAKEKKNINDLKIIKVPEHALLKVKNALEHNKHVEFVELDYKVQAVAYVTTDPKVSSQYYVNLMNFPAVWDLTQNQTLQEVIVSTPDTGINLNHVDLNDNMLTSLSKNTDDGSNNVDPVHGHGTATAGMISAETDNGVGIASLPMNVKNIPIKITNDAGGWAYYSNMAEAIYYAADNGAKVVSLSYAGIDSTTIRSAATYLRNKGGLFFMSAGNDGALQSYQGNGNWVEIIGVASTTSSDTRSSFSNYGNFVDIAAPGSSTYTTIMSGSYGYYSGTSFSSPVAASVAAFLFSAFPQASNVQIEQAIYNGAKDLGSEGYDIYYGHGRADALGAYNALLEEPVDTTPPSISINSPAEGSKFTSSSNIYVGATDLSGVKKVELYVNGNLYSTSTTQNNDVFTFYWDVSNLENGVYNISAIAYDMVDNTNDANTYYSVEKDTIPPTVEITYPTDNSTVTEKFLIIEAQATNAESVDFYIGDSYQGTDDSAPYSTKVNTRPLSGTSQIKAIAYAGNGLTESDVITVKFGKDSSNDDDSSTSPEPTVYECNDEKDNDNDGTCDYAGCYTKVKGKMTDLPADPKCSSATDDSERR